MFINILLFNQNISFDLNIFYFTPNCGCPRPSVVSIISSSSAVVSAPARALLSAPPRVTCGNRMRWLHWRLHFGASRLQVTIARSSGVIMCRNCAIRAFEIYEI